MPKIIHNREDCIGCNMCVSEAPGTWEETDDGKPMLKGSTKNNGDYEKEVTEEEAKKNKEVAENCPVDVIKVEE